MAAPRTAPLGAVSQPVTAWEAFAAGLCFGGALTWLAAVHYIARRMPMKVTVICPRCEAQRDVWTATRKEDLPT